MPTRHNPTRRAARAALQEKYHVEQTRRERAAKSRNEAQALDATAEPFDLPSVDLREDPDVPDEAVTALSLYGGSLRSLAQIKRVERFANLASLCVHGCRLTRMDVDPALRACRASLRELNLSSNRIARLEGFPALPELRVLDLTNNRLESLAGIDEGAPALTRLVVSRNALQTLHALGVPRADAKPWTLEHLDARGNALKSFADIAAGLGAVTSLKTLRLADEETAEAAGTRENGNPVTKSRAYRQAIAALAPWIEELDARALSRAGGDLALGSEALDEQGAFEKSAAEQVAAEKRRAVEAAEAAEDTDTYSESEATPPRSPRRRGSGKDGDGRTHRPVDEALARYKGRASAKGAHASSSRASGTYDALVAAGEDARRERTSEASRKAERGTSRRLEPREDPAVIDHEMRLRRIERNLVTAAAAANAQNAQNASAAHRTRAGMDASRVSVESAESTGGVAEAPAVESERLLVSPARAARVSGELRALKAQVAALEEALPEREGVRPGVETSKPGEPKRRDSKPGAKKKADARAGGGVSDADGDETKPPWRKPDLKPERGPTPTPATPTKRSAGGANASPAEKDDAEKTRRVDDESATSNAAETEATKTRSTREVRALEEALAASERSAAAAAETHASASKRAADDHAKFVAAMNVALSEANAARDAILEISRNFSKKSKGEVQDGEIEQDVSARQDPAALFRSALVARDAAAAELAEVRDEHAAAFASMREQHAAELAAKDVAAAAALAARDAATADAAEASASRDAAAKKTAAVEDEFRAALAESAAEHARLAAEVDEFTRVAREALHGKGEAERLAEELAEVCEQQRAALEEMARDRRRADRAEADCAAARADCGEMQTRLRAAEKRAAASKAAETAAVTAFDAVRDEKAAAHAALAEIAGVREHLKLATDNCRVKDAMLVSQAELVASLKAEAARSREAASGAVKAAAESERAADARARRAEDDVRRESGAVARLERALDEARGERDALAADVSDLKRSVGERDATLGYVGAEVESVKTMFATREEDLRRERDELAALVAERDEHEAAVRNEANAAREDAARAKAEAAEALADLAEKRESVDRVEAEAKETVRRVEGEMRALLAEVAAQRRKTRELGSALQSMYA